MKRTVLAALAMFVLWSALDFAMIRKGDEDLPVVGREREQGALGTDRRDAALTVMVF